MVAAGRWHVDSEISGGRNRPGRGKVFQAEDSAQRTAVLDTVLAIAAEIGASPDHVVIAWAMEHDVVPMIGPRNTAQLASNLGAMTVTLTPEQVSRLDDISAPPTNPAHTA